jgi:hypothetical protein
MTGRSDRLGRVQIDRFVIKQSVVSRASHTSPFDGELIETVMPSQEPQTAGDSDLY